MQTRNSLTVLFSTIVGVLLVAVLGLVACGGPPPSAGGAVPDVEGTASAPGGSNGSGAGTGWHHPRPWERPQKPASKPPKSKTPSTPPTSAKPPAGGGPAEPPANNKPPKAGKPAMGKATVPADAENRVAPDGLTSTTVFSSLEAGTNENGGLRTQTYSFPISGDTSNAVLDFQVSGYAFVDGPATAKLTVNLCGRVFSRVFRNAMDDDHLEEYRVKLHGASKCHVDVTVESRPEKSGGVALIDVLAVDTRVD